MSEESLQRIESKVDRVVDTLSEQSVTLARQHVTLEDHMRRTQLLEEAVEPLTRAHHMWYGAARVATIIAGGVTVLAAALGVAEGLYHVLGHFRP